MPQAPQTQSAIVQPPANQEPSIPAYSRQQITPFFVGLIVGVLLGYFFHWLTCRRDNKNRIKAVKDPFGVFIITQISNIPTERGVIKFYDDTKPAIKIEKDRLLHFLSRKKRRRINELWEQYDKEVPTLFDSCQEEGFKGVEGGAVFVGVEIMRDLYRLDGKALESNHDLMKRYLEKFYKYAS